jgi:hypothetical protein
MFPCIILGIDNTENAKLLPTRDGRSEDLRKREKERETEYVLGGRGCKFFNTMLMVRIAVTNDGR